MTWKNCFPRQSVIESKYLRTWPDDGVLGKARSKSLLYTLIPERALERAKQTRKPTAKSSWGHIASLRALPGALPGCGCKPAQSRVIWVFHEMEIMREAFFELMMAMSSTTGMAHRRCQSFTEIGVVAAAAAAVSSFLRLHCFTRAVQLFVYEKRKAKQEHICIGSARPHLCRTPLGDL